MIIRYLQLQHQFDATLLAAELEALKAQWIPHFNTYDYTGDWGGLPLRSPGGETNLVFAESLNGKPFENTPYLEKCPEMMKVLEALPGEKQAARLLQLSRGAVIREHRDFDLAFEQGEARLHIPIITHPDVEFWLDGHRLQMQPGECWYINANLPHKLSNPSPIDRVHLIVDVKVDEAMQKLFTEGPVKQKSEKEVQEDPELQAKIIEELLCHSDPKMRQLAEELKVRQNTPT